LSNKRNRIKSPESPPPAPDAPRRWSALRLAAVSAGLGIAIGFVAMVTINLLLPWSTPINVPAMPLEQLQALSAVEREALMRSGTVQVRTISGYERASYIVRAAPVQLRNDWIAYASPAFVAAFLCGWLASRGRGS
jgi:hypothetical protein